MLLPLIQVLMLCSFILLTTSPVVFILLAGNYFFKRTYGRGVVIAGSFILGALASGFVVWHLVPSEWSLPFWTTLEPRNGGRPRALNREMVTIVQHEQRRRCRSGSPGG